VGVEAGFVGVVGVEFVLVAAGCVVVADWPELGVVVATGAVAVTDELLAAALLS
jgi:hypothetical protein